MGDLSALPPIDAETRQIGLVVGWRSGRKTAAARVSIAGDALEALRDACLKERRRLSEFRPPIENAPGDDIALEPDEIAFLPVERVADPLGVRAHLEKPAALDLLPPAEIAAHTLLFYAVVVEAGGAESDATPGESFEAPAGRTAWIARANPSRLLRRGFFLWDQRGSLAKVETPIFVFEDEFDLVLTPERLYVVNPGAFETLFEETHITQEEAEKRVSTAIAAHLPVFGNGTEILARAASQRVAYRRLLDKIQEGDRLKGVTIRKVAAYARHQGIEPEAVVRDNALFVDEQDPGVLLRLLNEDLFTGGLTDTPFESAAKRARQRPEG